MRIPKHNYLATICSLVGAVLYSITAIVILLDNIGLKVVPFNEADPISALLLVIVAMVLFGAIKPLLKNNQDGYAFIVVGFILAGLLFILQLIILGTNALGWILRLEDWVEWILIDDLTPQLWLFPILGPILGIPWLLEYRKEEVIVHD